MKKKRSYSANLNHQFQKTGPYPRNGDFSRSHMFCAQSGSGGHHGVYCVFLRVVGGRDEVPSVTERLFMLSRQLFCSRREIGPGSKDWGCDLGQVPSLMILLNSIYLHKVFTQVPVSAPSPLQLHPVPPKQLIHCANYHIFRVH